MKKTPTEFRQHLRTRAEEELRANEACYVLVERSAIPKSRSTREREQLLHELKIHQIELEMQNEEMRQSQNGLELTLNTYAGLYDLAPGGYFIFTGHGVIREANLTGAQLLGVERRELANKPFISFIADADGRDVFSSHLEAVLQKQGMQKCELRLTGINGSVIHCFLKSTKLDNIGSMEGYILCSIVDGTDAKRLETEIQDAREYAENIVETVLEPLVVLKSDLKILTANHSFYDTFKVTPEETIGNFIYDLGNRQWDIPQLRVLFEDILPQNTVFNGYEVEHEFPGIGRKTILLNARQIFRKNIGSRIILLAMEDITDRKHAEDVLAEKQQELENLNRTLEVRIAGAVDELRQKDQMLILQDRLAFMGEMVNNIAHQWRQPLNILALNIQFLPLSYDSSDFNREYLEGCAAKCMKVINHMSQTVEDFMGFFKPGREEETFCVDSVVRQTLSLIEDYFKAQKISIAFHVEGEPLIKGYPNEYAQVLLNILSNARDALVERNVDDALISIRSFAEGGTTVVTITDNAGGIADGVIEELFNPFFTTKEPGKGTGIGLFMAKTIIEKNMGGSLTVRNIGGGAEFRITAMA